MITITQNPRKVATFLTYKTAGGRYAVKPMIHHGSMIEVKRARYFRTEALRDGFICQYSKMIRGHQ